MNLFFLVASWLGIFAVGGSGENEANFFFGATCGRDEYKLLIKTLFEAIELELDKQFITDKEENKKKFPDFEKKLKIFNKHRKDKKHKKLNKFFRKEEGESLSCGIFWIRGWQINIEKLETKLALKDFDVFDLKYKSDAEEDDHGSAVEMFQHIKKDGIEKFLKGKGFYQQDDGTVAGSLPLEVFVRRKKNQRTKVTRRWDMWEDAA